MAPRAAGAGSAGRRRRTGTIPPGGGARKSSAAELDIGSLYEHGLGVVRDYAQAAHWHLRQAAGHGNAEAQYDLGVVDAHGLGVTAYDANR